MAGRLASAMLAKSRRNVGINAASSSRSAASSIVVDAALAHDDAPVDDRRLDAAPRLAEDELPRRAVQRLVGDVVEIDRRRDRLSFPAGSRRSRRRDPSRAPRPGSRPGRRPRRARPSGCGSPTAASRQNIFIAWNMLWQSPQLQLSQPSATLTPACIAACIGATPLFSFRLLIGLCATPAPCSAISAISSRIARRHGRSWCAASAVRCRPDAGSSSRLARHRCARAFAVCALVS